MVSKERGIVMFCDKCGFKNKEDAKYCKKCGTSLEDIEEVLEKDFDNSQDDMKLTKKQLLKYLNLGKELEINKLGLEKGIKDLENLDKQKYHEIVKPLTKKDKPVFDKFSGNSIVYAFYIVRFLILPAYFVVMFTYRKFYDNLYSKFFAWDFPDIFASVPITIVVLIILFIILSIIFIIIELTIHNTVGRQKYTTKMKNYNKESDKIDETNKNQMILYNESKIIIDDRKNNVENDLKDVEKTLSKFYDLDVIYPKYRNLIALTTFVEYLESGRCKSLYGYTGCYNVYEQELRQNTIINKLDQVLIQLDQIKKTQYATYLAIQASNALQSIMLNTCNEMLDETRRENAKLEAQAQDNKIIKRNSEILTTIAEFDYIKK